MRNRRELDTTLSFQLQGAGVEGRVDKQTKPSLSQDSEVWTGGRGD